MPENFIDRIHFVPREVKMTKEWCLRVVNQLYYSAGRCLLEGKDVNAIEKFATGSHPMNEYREMYKNSVRKAASAEVPAGLSDSDATNFKNNYIKTGLQDDLKGIDFSPIGLLVQPLNSAIAAISKQPFEVVATAIDALASEKKKSDRQILKNRDAMMQAMADVSSKLGGEPFDIGGARNNSTGVDEMPFGLTAQNEAQLNTYFDLFYKLKPESAFETLLEQWAFIKKLDATKDLEIKDHFYFGVSANRSFKSDTTGLPDIERRIHPKDIVVSRGSVLPDFSDSPYIRQDIRGTVRDFYNAFGSDIGTVEDLYKIVNGWAAAQKGSVPMQVPAVDTEEFWNWKFSYCYVEWKSIDGVNVATGIDMDGNVVKTILPLDYESAEDIQLSRRFAENTYSCYWVPGTESIFRNERLSGFERKKGQEYFSPFSFNIWRSQDGKSSVELCISEVRMAQKAYIKLQHCIIKSKPQGVYLDLKFLRQAIEGLNGQGGYDMISLMNLFFNHNIMIGDSTDINPNEANMMPFHIIPGGIGKEVEGYWNTIAMCAQTISRVTGINDQLTGQSANPEGLVGLQKLLVNASINSIHYVTIGIQTQYRALFNHWAYLFMDILKNGSDAEKNAIKELITSRKADFIEDIDTVAVHQYGVQIEVGNHEELKAETNQYLALEVQRGNISSAEALLARRIKNPKDQLLVLLMLDSKTKERQDRQQQAVLAAQQNIAQMQAQVPIQQEQLRAEGKNSNIQAQAQADAYILQLSQQLGMSSEYVKNLYKNQQIEARKQGQIEKSLVVDNNKASLEAQKALA